MDSFNPNTVKIHHKTPLIPDDFRNCAVVGSTRTGKTSLLPKILSKLHDFKYLIIFAKHPNQEVYKHIIAHAKEKGTHVYVRESPDMELIESLRDKLKESNHNVVIVDDFLENKILDPLTSLASAGRHMNLSNYFLVQDFYALPKDIRLNLTEFMILRCDNFTDMLKKLPHFLPNDEMVGVYNEVIDKPYNFLYVCKDAMNPVLRVRKGFNGVLKSMIPPQEEK